MIRFYKDPKLQKAEKTLSKFFEGERKIEAIKNTNITLSQQLRGIDKSLRTNDFLSLDVNLGSIGYEERVQTSISNTSSQEKALIKCVDRLTKEKEEIQQKIFENNEFIRKVQRESAFIKAFIDGLCESDKELVISRYKKEMNDQDIALEMNLSSSAVGDRRRKIIKKFIKWMEE